jgi:hypothetical protein
MDNSTDGKPGEVVFYFFYRTRRWEKGGRGVMRFMSFRVSYYGKSGLE